MSASATNNAASALQDEEWLYFNNTTMDASIRLCIPRPAKRLQFEAVRFYTLVEERAQQSAFFRYVRAWIPHVAETMRPVEGDPCRSIDNFLA